MNRRSFFKALALGPVLALQSTPLLADDSPAVKPAGNPVYRAFRAAWEDMRVAQSAFAAEFNERMGADRRNTLNQRLYETFYNFEASLQPMLSAGRKALKAIERGE